MQDDTRHDDVIATVQRLLDDLEGTRPCFEQRLRDSATREAEQIGRQVFDLYGRFVDLLKSTTVDPDQFPSHPSAIKIVPVDEHGRELVSFCIIKAGSEEG